MLFHYWRCALTFAAACVTIGLLLAARVAVANVSGMVEVVGGLDNPIFVTHAPGDRERLFIVEESGAIRIFNFNTGLNATPFLTIPNVDTGGEGGILGLAFHPQYSMPGSEHAGKFYVYATIDPNNNQTAPEPFLSHIREYTVSANPDIANAAPREILNFLQPQDNHNGGWIGFSPNDDYLYINFGDGGGGNDDDPGHTAGIGNGQDITDNFFGKTLRLDVNGDDDFAMDTTRNYRIPDSNPFADVRDPDTREVTEAVFGDDEIWAYGLRNPFRASFDRLTGDMWTGDVGQGAREEIDFQPADSTGGANYGWRLREGNIQTPGSVGGGEPAGYIPPVYDYTRGTGTFQGFTVIGGYVYRGPDPELQGLYFFADAGSRHVWNFDPDNPFGTVDNINTELGALHAQLGQPVSFGEDAVGNLYLVDYGSQSIANGQVFRIITDALLAGDYDADGDVDEDDYFVWKDKYGTTFALADGNDDGMVNAADYTVWRNNLGASVHNQGSGAGIGESNVPEPATFLLFAQFAVLLAMPRLGRRRLGRL